MPLPADLTALAATSNARKWKLDIDLSPLQDGTGYVRVKGCTEFTFNPGTPTLQPDSDYDSEGYSSSSATAMEWGGTLTVRRGPGRLTPTAYDPGQEALRTRGTKMGQENTARVRIYEEAGAANPRVEAYEGYAAVSYANGGGDQAALSVATITLTGQGACLPITHPAGTTAVAQVYSLVYASGGSSVAAAGGDLITITGTGFLSATSVTVKGTAVTAPNRQTINDSKMVIKVPANTAGAGNVTVTNAAGTSPTGVGNAITYV